MLLVSWFLHNTKKFYLYILFIHLFIYLFIFMPPRASPLIFIFTHQPFDNIRGVIITTIVMVIWYFFSWTRILTFLIMLTLLDKLCIHVISFQLFNLRKATILGKGKLWIRTSWTSIKQWPYSWGRIGQKEKNNFSLD